MQFLEFHNYLNYITYKKGEFIYETIFNKIFNSFSFSYNFFV